MPNRNKQKGDRFESAALLTAQGFFPDAFRTRAGWDDDRGDIVLDKRHKIIVQAKDCQSKPWYVWLDELDAQIKNADAEYGCVVSKRRGKGDAGEAMAVMRYRDFLALAQHV
jgi:hypothetical protein